MTFSQVTHSSSIWISSGVRAAELWLKQSGLANKYICLSQNFTPYPLSDSYNFSQTHQSNRNTSSLSSPLSKRASQNTQHVVVTPNPVHLAFVHLLGISTTILISQITTLSDEKMLLSLITNSKPPSHWNTGSHWDLKPKITTFSIFQVLESISVLLSLLNPLVLDSHSSSLHNTKTSPYPFSIFPLVCTNHIKLIIS